MHIIKEYNYTGLMDVIYENKSMEIKGVK